MKAIIKFPSLSHTPRHLLSKSIDKKVEFLFMTDKIDIDNFNPAKIKINNGTHLLGKFPLENEKFVFPFTAHA